DRFARQVEEEDLVETALADELGRQRGDVICGRDDEYFRFLLRKPREKRAEQTPPSAAVAVARGDALPDFAHPEHARCEHVGGGERLAQIALRFADVRVVDRGEIQA